MTMDDRVPGSDQPHVLRTYALLADGERGAVVGPTGEIAWLCFPGWDDDTVLASLLGGNGRYVVRPAGRFVWGGHYEDGTLVWRNRWIVGDAVTECVEALGFPGRPDRAVLVRRVVAARGAAEVVVRFEPARGVAGKRPTRLKAVGDGVWEGRLGDVAFRWQVPVRPDWREGAAELVVRLPPGSHADLVLELGTTGFDDAPADPDEVLVATAARWRDLVPALAHCTAADDARRAIAVLRGLTASTGAMVASATTSLPERARRGRDYDYRYAWIRDQCYTGIAAAHVPGGGGDLLLDDAVRFVHERLLADGPELRPAYRTTGEPVPSEREVGWPGYPGGIRVMVGNRANRQFQLDVFGEALTLFAAAAERERAHGDVWRAADTAVAAIESRWTEPDAGAWELGKRRFTHSRLACVAGLRQLAAHAPRGPRSARWLALADAITAEVSATSTHPSGRWQRAADDDRCDAALVLAGLRGAIPVDDPRTPATVAAVRRELVADGYVYRYRISDAPLGQAEGAFLLCGFWLSLACRQLGDRVAATRFFERNRSACGPPGLFTEEYDVHQHQLRGNFPQAFVHALLLETASVLSGDDPSP